MRIRTQRRRVRVGVRRSVKRNSRKTSTLTVRNTNSIRRRRKRIRNNVGKRKIGFRRMPIDRYQLPSLYEVENLSNEDLPWFEEFEKILVVSIRPVRLQGLRIQLKNWSNRIVHVNSVNGLHLDVEKYYRNGFLRRNIMLTRGQIGCFLSHINAWKYIVAHNLNCGLIMEDDANLTYTSQMRAKIQLVLDEIGAKNLGWDVLHIGFWIPDFASTSRIGSYTGIVHPWAGLHGYCVSRQGADILLSHSQRGMYEPVDIHISNLRKSGILRCLYAVPPIFSQRAACSDTTHI